MRVTLNGRDVRNRIRDEDVTHVVFNYFDSSPACAARWLTRQREFVRAGRL
jgi:hypothetical protein